MQTILSESGWKQKEEVDKIAASAFREGMRKAKVETPSRVEKPRSEVPKDAGDETAPATTDPFIIEMHKTLKAVRREISELKGENESLKREQVDREIAEKAKRIIAEIGMDSPDTVLYLSKRDVHFIPDPTDPNELQVVRARDSIPVDGPGTFTNAREFFARFSKTPEGMRFRNVPQPAKTGAGMTGAQGQPASPGPLAADNLMRGMKALGIT